MSDFLSRLAGRALRQTPVLEPLVASWHAPLAPALEAPDEQEVHRSSGGALGSPQAAVSRQSERRRAAVVPQTALPRGPVPRMGATAHRTIERVMHTDVESAATLQAVDSREPIVAAPGAVVVNRASAKNSDHVGTEDYQGEVRVQGPLEVTPALTVKAGKRDGPQREAVLARDSTIPAVLARDSTTPVVLAQDSPLPVAADAPVEQSQAVDRPRASSP